jgi:hypothetical protein
MRAPMPRGRGAPWRYLEGTFMPYSEKSEAYLAEYERYAAGTRERALRRGTNVGRFLSNEERRIPD